jgi:Uma2 family endonuclease
MKLPTERRMTLEQFLDYDDGTDTCYELEDGVLVAMAPESPLNDRVANFLLGCFLQLGIPAHRLARTGLVGTNPTRPTGRIPDLIVHSDESDAAVMADTRLLRWDAPPPMLVVEVVSSSDTDKKSRQRDYEDKRVEYAARSIPEYWIVDPIAAVVLVLTLEGTEYQEQRFTGEMAIASPAFPDLNLTVDVLLRAGRPLRKSQMTGGDRP